MRARPGRLITAAACCAALAALPASVAQATSTGGALSTSVPSSRTAPGVHLVATPAHPVVGVAVQVSVGAAPPGATAFAWDLSGQGAFTRHTAVAQTVVE